MVLLLRMGTCTFCQNSSINWGTGQHHRWIRLGTLAFWPASSRSISQRLLCCSPQSTFQIVWSKTGSHNPWIARIHLSYSGIKFSRTTALCSWAHFLLNSCTALRSDCRSPGSSQPQLNSSIYSLYALCPASCPPEPSFLRWLPFGITSNLKPHSTAASTHYAWIASARSSTSLLLAGHLPPVARSP